jgi:membrane-associated protease RseP (regulator of RpoE activity)
MILNLLIVLLGIAAIIAIHEACHMIVSKLFGVKILKFSLGFGPVIFSKKIGDTSYELALLPIGGYVLPAGDDPESDEPNGFFSLVWYKRALIALAGPIANLILGFVMILGLLVLCKGWPIWEGLGRAYMICSMVITETLKWVFGIHSQYTPEGSRMSQLSGPIMVGKVLLTSLKDGFTQFFFILSVISLSLGLFNLFPLPSLDGGIVALCLAEFIKGGKFSRNVYIIWNYVGFVLLISLMIFMCFMDISKLIK